MKNWMLILVVGLLAAPLIAADGSFPGVETLVYRTASLSYPDLAVASTPDTDLVIWTSLSHLYGARVSRNGELIDEVPMELSTFAAYPSVASDGDRFMVMWNVGAGEPGFPQSFQARIVDDRGEPSPVINVLANAHRRSRPRLMFGDGRFAFAWLGWDAPGSFISFVTLRESSITIESMPGPWTVDSMNVVYPPIVIPTRFGASAIGYVKIPKLPGCQTICIPGGTDDAAVYQDLLLLAGRLEAVATSAPFLRVTTSELVQPLLLRLRDQPLTLWTTDEFIPQRTGGDTIRAMRGAAPDVAQSEVVFSSPLGDIAALGAAADDDDLWLAWIDRMPDRDPAEPWRLFIARVGADVTVYPSLQNAARLAVSSSRGHVAVAAFVPAEVGGSILLESISGPTRSRAVRR